MKNHINVTKPAWLRVPARDSNGGRCSPALRCSLVLPFCDMRVFLLGPESQALLSSSESTRQLDAVPRALLATEREHTHSKGPPSVTHRERMQFANLMRL